jgi:CheY-like chemotaxis protein
MVEDSATDAELALRAFKLADFANPVMTVPSGEQGLDYLFGTGLFAARGPTRPQLILLDLNLPKMSGIDFLHRVRADGRTRDIPVVVLSLSESSQGVTACIELGAEAYLVKPVNAPPDRRRETGSNR